MSDKDISRVLHMTGWFNEHPFTVSLCMMCITGSLEGCHLLPRHPYTEYPQMGVARANIIGPLKLHLLLSFHVQNSLEIWLAVVSQTNRSNDPTTHRGSLARGSRRFSSTWTWSKVNWSVRRPSQVLGTSAPEMLEETAGNWCGLNLFKHNIT